MSRSSHDLDARAVAFLYTEGVHRLKTIAEMLGLAPYQVTKLLQEARRKGWFRQKEELVLRLSDHDRAQVELRISAGRFHTALRQFSKAMGVRPLEIVRVFPTGEQEWNWDKRLDRFGEAAAGLVRELIRNSRTVGAAWGSTPAAIVAGLRALPVARSAARFFPICGEPLADDLTDTSASRISAGLAKAIRGSERYATSLHNVPALIPADFNSQELDAIYKLLSRTPAYGEVFGNLEAPSGEPRLLDSTDAVLTSVSADGEPWGSRSGALRSSARIEAGELRRMCIGDIGGVLLPAPRHEARVQSLMRNWTGVKLSDLETIAKNGRVIVVAIGSNKSKVLFEVLRRGLCSHLLVDAELFDAVSVLIHDALNKLQAGQTRLRRRV